MPDLSAMMAQDDGKLPGAEDAGLSKKQQKKRAKLLK